MDEKARFWHRDDAGPVDFLKATYYTHSFPKHTHEGYVFGVITQGVEAFEMDGALYDAEAGSLVVINPGETHTGFAPLKIGWSYRTIYPDAAVLNNIAGSGRDGVSGLPGFSSPVIRDPLLADRFLAMHRLNEYSFSALEREEAFSAVLSMLIDRYSDSRISPLDPSAKEPRMVEEVCSYLSARYSENPSLSDLAGLTGFSPWYLTRVFTRSRGIPPHSWLKQYRLNRARDMLLKGIKAVDVATECGFTDQSHLTRHFKKYFGFTPGRIS